MATLKTFGGIYLAILITALVMGVSLRFSGTSSVFSQWNFAVSNLSMLGINWAMQMAVIGTFCYFALVIAMFVVLAVSICQRFYKNLLGNEGYLMHTLPVTPAMLLLSKLLVALMWTALSILVLFVSMSILVLILSSGFSVDYSFLREYLSYFDFNTEFWVIALMMASSYLGMLLSVYLAMIIGHYFKKGVIFISIITYFLIDNIRAYLILALASLVENTPLVYIANATPMVVDYFMALLLQLAFAALYFFCAEYLLRKHLNIE